MTDDGNELMKHEKMERYHAELLNMRKTRGPTVTAGTAGRARGGRREDEDVVVDEEEAAEEKRRRKSC